MAIVINSGRMEPAMPTKPRLVSETTKPANTFSVMWPASMLANKRTDREMGRERNEMISIAVTRGMR